MSDQTLVTYEFIEAKDKEIECLTALWQTVHASNYKLRDRVDKLEARNKVLEDGVNEALEFTRLRDTPHLKKIIKQLRTIAEADK